MTEFITDRRSFLTERYDENVHPVFRALERSVLGCDFALTLTLESVLNQNLRINKTGSILRRYCSPESGTHLFFYS
jgi:hypothetical protein